MAYYLKVLRPDEEVHFLGRLHWIIYRHGVVFLVMALALALARLAMRLPPGQAGALIGAAGFMAGLGLVNLLASWVRCRTTEIVVTNLRVITKTGLIGRRTTEMNISKIESVDVLQGLLARMLGYGTVIIRGTGAGLEPLVRVADPIGLRSAILVG